MSGDAEIKSLAEIVKSADLGIVFPGAVVGSRPASWNRDLRNRRNASAIEGQGLVEEAREG